MVSPFGPADIDPSFIGVDVVPEPLLPGIAVPVPVVPVPVVSVPVVPVPVVPVPVVPVPIVPEPIVSEPMLPGPIVLPDMFPDPIVPEPAAPEAELPGVCAVPGPMPLAIASCCSLRRRVAARASPPRRDDDADALPLMLFCAVTLLDRGAALAAPVTRPTPITTAIMVLLFTPNILSCRALMENQTALAEKGCVRRAMKRGDFAVVRPRWSGITTVGDIE